MKKIKYLLTSLSLFLISMPVMAIKCNGIDIDIDNKIPNTVHLVIVFLQIAVPVLLVIFGMIDLIKAIIAGKEDEIKKNQNVFVRRLITGVLVFFVVVVVRLVFSFATSDDKAESENMWKCADCFINGTDKCKGK